MSHVPRRVVKLGGSLLELCDLRERLTTWLTGQPAAEVWLLVGGGRLADVVRDIDRLHGLDSATAHWLAIRAMAINAEIVAQLVGGAKPSCGISTPLQPAKRPDLVIVDPCDYMQRVAPRLSPDPLPEDWEVTSDSIAARLAVDLRAELVLLKSALPEEPRRYASAASAGYVDRYFPQAAGAFEAVVCVNLREADQPPALLRH